MSKKIQSQSFIKGSVILLAASLLVKLIGALFKIPLANLIGDEGMAYFTSAYNIYVMLFVIATAGLPVALSKMVSESLVLGNVSETKRIFRAAYIVFLSVGIIGSLILFFGAGPLSRAIIQPKADLSIMILAPAILFVSVMSVYRGFFQGTSDMMPTAVSEVIEALGKLVIGYALAYLLIGQGLRMASAGAITGVTAGALLAVIFLMAIYARSKKAIYEAEGGGDLLPRSYKELLKELVKIAFPITISASVFTITNLIDTLMITTRLESIRDLLIIELSPTELYGLYGGKAVTMFNMPPTMVVSLCLPLVPAVAGAFVLKDRLKVKKISTVALKIALIFALPCAVGMGVLAGPIMDLLFPGTHEIGAPLLMLLGPAIAFVCMIMVSNSLLQATGRVYVPVVNIAIAAVAKIVLSYVLLGIPQVHILGAPIATSVCYLIYMVLNLIYVVKITKVEIGFGFWLKPIIAAAAMGVVTFFGYDLFESICAGISQGKMMEIVALGAAIAVAVVVYLVVLLTVGGITREEVESMPGGKKIAAKMGKILR